MPFLKRVKLSLSSCSLSESVRHSFNRICLQHSALMKVLRGLADDGPCKSMGWVLFKMHSWSLFALFFLFVCFVFIFIPPYFSITKSLSNIINPVDFLQPLRRDISDITLKQLKLRTIIDQTGTYIYKASKFIAKYLGPLAKNDYAIRYTLSFSGLLKSAASDDNYEDVLYDVESLLTSIPVQETIIFSTKFTSKKS